MPTTGCGIGLRAPHVAELVERRPAVGWLEVHAENYMGGGPAIRTLLALRHDYPISLHGVGLSLGSPDDGNDRHLERLARLVERVEPVLISEHLAWSVADGRYLNHLLPLPYTPEALALLIDRIARVQDRLGRRLLVENPSGYLRFRESPIPEAAFLDELARRTGCGLLCDVNNIYVTCANLGGSAEQWLDALTPSAVAEIHLAGHVVNDADGTRLLIDDHGSAVTDDVWRLYERALGRFGAVPTLVEWDTELPALDVLLAEADKAQRRLAAANADAAAA
jgi:uncharacterized protein (UPF0276 family)